jgi:hypothetical protein
MKFSAFGASYQRFRALEFRPGGVPERPLRRVKAPEALSRLCHCLVRNRTSRVIRTSL